MASSGGGEHNNQPVRFNILRGCKTAGEKKNLQAEELNWQPHGE